MLFLRKLKIIMRRSRWINFILWRRSMLRRYLYLHTQNLQIIQVNEVMLSKTHISFFTIY